MSYYEKINAEDLIENIKYIAKQGNDLSRKELIEQIIEAINKMKETEDAIPVSWLYQYQVNAKKYYPELEKDQNICNVIDALIMDWKEYSNV